MQPNAPQTAAAQISDLEAVRAALKLDHVVLVGDSYGGLLSIAYAAAHPEHIARLVSPTQRQLLSRFNTDPTHGRRFRVARTRATGAIACDSKV